MSRTCSLLLASALLVTAVSACGSTERAACGPILHDRLDPSSLSHVLPGAPTPSYLTDPPTSGAHQPGPKIQGVQKRPIAPQIQVGLLEEGQVIVQYHGLDEADVAELRGLASHAVVVAPAASLPDGARVVATAWVTRQVCTAVDLDRLHRFIEKGVSKDHAHS